MGFLFAVKMADELVEDVTDTSDGVYKEKKNSLNELNLEYFNCCKGLTLL